MIDVGVLTTGTDAVTLVESRQILRWVLTRRRPAHAFVLAHNHPSGDPTPSHEDLLCTRAVRDAGRVVGLILLDHVVVTDDGFTSIAAQGGL